MSDITDFTLPSSTTSTIDPKLQLQHLFEVHTPQLVCVITLCSVLLAGTHRHGPVCNLQH